MKGKRPVVFGFRPRNALSGGELALRLFQVLSLLPLPYILIAPGYPALVTRKGLLHWLFGLGISALPRGETLALSLLYRQTGSEVWVHLALLALALVFGLAGGRLLRGNASARPLRIVLCVLLGADLLFRALPTGLSPAFGPFVWVPALLLRAASLLLLLLDLRAEKRSDGE